MAKQNEGVVFATPKNVGNAEPPVEGGIINKKTLVKETSKPVRNIKVVALDKGFFDHARIEPGDKFMVSEQEFSELWMEKI